MKKTFIPKGFTKRNPTIFRKGKEVISNDGTVVLITGQGNKKEGYPCFAGVVIETSINEDSEGWPKGMYSDTWTKDNRVFQNVDVHYIVTNPAK